MRSTSTAQQCGGLFGERFPHGIINLDDVPSSRPEQKEVEEGADQINAERSPPSQLYALNAEEQRPALRLEKKGASDAEHAWDKPHVVGGLKSAPHPRTLFGILKDPPE